MYLSVEPLHVPRLERRAKRAHLVDCAPKRPDIAFAIVGLISPDLRTGVIGSPRLRICQAPLQDLRHVQISELIVASGDKYVRALQIPVHDLQVVQHLQPIQQMVDYAPQLVLVQVQVALAHQLYLLLRVGLGHTCRSPPSAYSITMHRQLLP